VLKTVQEGDTVKRIILSLCICLTGAQLLGQDPAPQWQPEPGWSQRRLLGGARDLLADAQNLEKRGKYDDAADAYAKLARLSNLPANKGLAMKKRADMHLAAGEHRRAYLVYQTVAREYAPHVPIAEVAGKLRLLADAYATGDAGFLWFDESAKAIDIYNLILELAPIGPEAPRDMMVLARYQENQRQYDAAIETYRNLQRRFPLAAEAAEARLALSQTMLKKAQLGTKSRDLARRARAEARQFLQQHPDHPGAGTADLVAREANEILAGYLLYLAEFYTRPAHYRPKAARRYLQTLLELYADTSLAPDAEIMLARLDGEDVAPVDEREYRDIIAEDRMLPKDYIEAYPEPEEPPPYIRGEKIIEDRERATKWLLPITDLGIGKEQE
jgi:outer membrane protein assembly factor BamD (BamD/ComL family)